MRRTKLVARAALLFSLVGSLTFGASEVFAADPARTCPNDGYNAFGECVSLENCQFLCEGVGGIQGNCISANCCFCEH